MLRRVPRLSLSTFLILTATAGCVLGWIGRYYWFAPTYQLRSRMVNGFRVESQWVIRWGRDPELLHMIGYGEPNTVGGNSDSRPQLSLPARGVGSHPHGVYLGGRFHKDDQGRKVWVHESDFSVGSLRIVESISANDMSRFTVEQFDTLETSTLWSEKFQPALKEASIAYCKRFFEREGALPSSRYYDELLEWARTSARQDTIQQPPHPDNE